MVNRRAVFFSSVAVAVGVLLSSCSMVGLEGAQRAASSTPASASASATRSVYGYIVIADKGMTSEKAADQQQRLWDSGDSSCVAPAGYEDIAAGGAVQILGPDGVLATGEIAVGDFQSDVMSANGVIGCGFPFVVDEVPTGLDRYGLHVGATTRPAYAFTESEMRSGPRLILP